MAYAVRGSKKKVFFILIERRRTKVPFEAALLPILAAEFIGS